jgi:hypothetical protein
MVSPELKDLKVRRVIKAILVIQDRKVLKA